MSIDPLVEAGVTDAVVVSRSASGSVYRARRQGNDVAVKVPMHRLPVEALRLLPRHRGIVRIDDVDDAGAWMVMEFCTGGSYADRVVAEAEVVALGVALAGTLAAVHTAGVLHGDVTPSNVLRRGTGEPVLADWGHARLSTVDNPAPVEGVTPAYTAPEIFRGGIPTVATDVFALGATLRAVAADPGRWLVDVLDRATAADPDDRYASAGEVLSALGAPAARDRG